MPNKGIDTYLYSMRTHDEYVPMCEDYVIVMG
jgi:hypothetical protein